MIRIRVLLVMVVGALVAVGGALGFLIGVTAAAVVELVLLRMAIADPGRWRLQLRRRPKEPATIPGYATIRTEVAWATYSRFDYDHRLRRRLQRILAARLATHSQPGGAPGGRDPVGADLWPLLDPGRPATRDRDAAGVRLDELDRLVGALERM